MIKKFASLPLNYRLSIAFLVPLALIILSLTGFSIQTSKTFMDHNIELFALSRANFSAKNIDVALYSENHEVLKKRIQLSMELKFAQGTLFLNKDQQIIVASDNFPMPSQPFSDLILAGSIEEQLLYHIQPVFLSGIDFSDYASELDKAPEEALAGWVVVALDISESRSQHLSILLTTLLFTVIGLFIAITITYFLSRSILAPIQSLTDTVVRIKEGDLTARAKIYPHHEFALLGEVINVMAATVEKGTTNLEDQINNATSRLQETLADLQRKNDELQIAREQSEKSSQSKTQFLARMSHELRTPITSIQGFARLLNESVINELDQQHCHIIDQAANQLLLLINDILDYSKLQSNTVVLDMQPFSLTECVAQIADQFSLTAHEKGLEFIVDISPSLAANRLGDVIRVRQIINNLLSNAFKFTKSGGVYMTLTESTDEGTVRLSVRDTGIGIKSSDRDQLFQAFSQADTSISRQFGGSGLGLSIAKTLVNLMGGSLFFHSALSEGSDFIVEIPLKEVGHQVVLPKTGKEVLVYHSNTHAFFSIQHALARLGLTAISYAWISGDTADYPVIIYYLPPKAHLAKSLAKKLIIARNDAPDSRFIMVTPINIGGLLTNDVISKLEPVTSVSNPPSISALDRAINNKNPSGQAIESPKKDVLSNLNILIAEDNQFTCLLLETLIERYGGVFSTATNGLEAVKASLNEPFDILLIDVHMPELNGHEAIRKIRRGNGVNKETPIIALTADLQQQNKSKLKQAGATEMLLKPLNENLLLEVIMETLELDKKVHQEPKSGPDIVSEGLYLRELHSLANTINDAIGSEDWPKAGEYIHQMLGVAGVFELGNIDVKVTALHRTFKAQQFNELKALLDDLVKDIPKPSIA